MDMILDDNERPYITASEIGQYQYCSLAWYLKKCGYTPQSPSLKKGVHHHHYYGKQLKRKQRMEHLSTLCFFLGCIGIIVIILILLVHGGL